MGSIVAGCVSAAPEASQRLDPYRSCSELKDKSDKAQCVATHRLGSPDTQRGSCPTILYTHPTHASGRLPTQSSIGSATCKHYQRAMALPSVEAQTPRRILTPAYPCRSLYNPKSVPMAFPEEPRIPTFWTERQVDPASPKPSLKSHQEAEKGPSTCPDSSFVRE